ncbi:hypothetical protein [Enterobacter sp. PTB]|uniref:hypothetical protein n=1 Tax=Enterobacter sp. PTB TaxID=3143437 RepID=UPI003DA95629
MKMKPGSSSVGAAEKSATRRNHYVQWTLAEIAFVEKHYGKLPAREIATTLGRGVAAVRSMALKIGVGRPGAKPWEMWEINIMKKHYSHGAGIAMVRALLPHRDMESIRKQAARAGLTDVREWHPDAIAFLREHYGHMPVEEVAAALDKSVSAVRNRANVLKLGKTQLSRWTREENAILTGHYGNSGNLDAIHSLLPHRSRKAIEAQVAKLGLTRAQIWTPEELSILQQLYPILGRKLTRVLPGRTNSAIHHQAERLGLRRYAKKHSGKPEHDKG